MRLPLLLPLLLPLVCACGFPDLDVPEGDRVARADYPDLVPFGDVTGRAEAMPPADAAIGQDLEGRAGALRDRAAAIGGDAPGADAEAQRRADGLRARAQALR